MAGTRFPVSDHCDGTHFFNPAGRLQMRGFSQLPRWWWQRLVKGQGSRWPRTVPAPRTPVLPEGIPAGQMAVTFIGHSTFLLQLPGLNILTDPVFASHAGPFGLLGPKRARPAALQVYANLARAKAPAPAPEALKALLVEARQTADAAGDLKQSLEFARQLSELEPAVPAAK